jgi:hypothetical protein
LIFYYEMKLGWGKEEYMTCSTRKEKRGLAWFRMDMRRLRGIRQGWKGRRCPLCREVELPSTYFQNVLKQKG